MLRVVHSYGPFPSLSMVDGASSINGPDPHTSSSVVDSDKHCVVDYVLPLEQSVEVWHFSQESRSRGKAVLSVS